MKVLFGILLIVTLPATAIHAQTDFPKMDTTVLFGKTGYRVECKNKSYTENMLEVRPVGFKSEAREVSFMMHGRTAKAEIDDLNGDGYPDLVLFVCTDSNANFGTIYAFISKANKSITGCVLPDPMMDGKINEGYKGHNQFSVMQGYLLEKFPVYKPADDKDKPSGGLRSILYQLVPDEGERFKFQKVRSYDTP